MTGSFSAFVVSSGTTSDVTGLSWGGIEAGSVSGEKSRVSKPGLGNTVHITSSVFINDDESGLHHDFGKWLEELALFNPDPDHYHHNRTGEDNADAHLKRQIMGREVVVAITKGILDFGPWEQIFYGELDGHRDNRVLIKIIGE